jgi:class 3 adenylate cyclase
VRATVIGSADGGQAARLFAAMYPARVEALVLTNAFPRWFRSHDYPFGFEEADAEGIAGLARRFWGRAENPWGLAVVAPSRIDDPEFKARYARWQQYSASPATGSDVFLVRGNDVRTVLPSVQARTLVLHPAEVPDDAMQRTLFLADLIDGAVVATFPGEDLVGADTLEAALVIEEFVTGGHASPVGDRVLATVLFTDIVSSTDRLSAIGDRAWRTELDGHDAMVRERLAQFRGREIDTAGDGFFAVFDGPAQAIRCAQAIIEGAHALGIEVRAGVHTGECEARGGGYAGIAVHTGARVAALAGDGEVYATRTVKDLVAGSGIVFEDCGVHQLKGIPEPWQVYRVVSA